MSRYRSGMVKVEGAIPAVVTPFDEKEDVNEAALRTMVRRLLAAGAHGLFCLGTNGEFYALTADEKIRVVEVVVDETNGRVPVYAGAGSTNTRETVELARRFEDAGADALSLITPYFMSYSQNELVRYFKTAAEATSLPMTLYNIPARTGNALQPNSVAELAKVPNIVGIKDSSGSFDTIIQYIEAAPDDFAVMSGNDGLILATLMAGGKGTVSAMANVCPDVVVSIYEHWKAGDLHKAEEAQKVLRVARQALRLGTQPAALKAFVNKLGLEAGPARLPVAPLSDGEQARLDRIAKEYLEIVEARN